MFGNYREDLDDDDLPQVRADDIDGRVKAGIEEMRSNFFHQKRHWLEYRKDGNYYNMLHRVYGPKTADARTAGTDIHFRQFLANALLTEEGETTNPAYPVDKMIRRELRRIRATIIQDVSNFFSNIENDLPEDPMHWSRSILDFYFAFYLKRYEKLKFEITVVIPGKKLARPRMHEVNTFIEHLAKEFSNPKKNEGMNARFQLDRLTQELSEFLLVDLPYTNERLNKKEEAIPAVGKPVEEETKILH